MDIRPESPSEFSTIYGLVTAAFATAPHADGDEQDFVARLRAGAGYLPDLALVGQEEGALVAHAMLTRLPPDPSRRPSGLLLLAPVSVAPGAQRRGFGSALVRDLLARAAAGGHRAVVVLGDPGYYGRFGFKPAIGFGLSHTGPFADENVMAMQLAPGALVGAAGAISFPS